MYLFLCTRYKIKQIVYSNMFDKYFILGVMVRESHDTRGTQRSPKQSTDTAENGLHCHLHSPPMP